MVNARSVLSSITLAVALLGASTAFAAGSHDGIEVLTPANFNTSGLVHNSWHVLGSRPTIELFINQPRHNQPAGTYNLANLPLQYRVQYGVCNNAPSAARVIGRFDQTGGVCRTSFDANANWVTVHNQTYNNQSAIAGTNVGGYWLSEGSFNGNVNISGVSPSADKTTFQLYATWAPDAGHFGVYGEDHFLQYRRIHAVNLCINIDRGPVCGNGKVEQGEQCDDGNQNNADACNNQCQTVSSQTDVKLEKIVFNPSVTKKGTRVTFILRATNLTSVPAASARIVDNIPAGLIFDSDPQHSSSFCTAVGTQVTCDLGSLPGNTTRDAVVSFLIPTTYQAGTCPASVTNTATFYTSTAETNAQNNTASATQSVPCDAPTDIKIEKTVFNAAVMHKGLWSSFNLKATNISTIDAENVVIQDTVPAGLTFDPAHTSGVCTLQGQKVICPIGKLRAGASYDVNVAFSIPENYQGTSCPGSIVNTATTQTTTLETNFQNNTSTITAKVLCGIELTKTVAPVVQRGGNVTYTFTIRNPNDVALRQVTMGDHFVGANKTDIITPPFTFVSVSSTQCSFNGTRLGCNFGDMQPRETKTVTMVMSVPQAAPCGTMIVNVVDAVSVVDSTKGWAMAQTTVQCPSASCGNGTVETGEQCDDGNQSNADQCNNSCQKTSCQDGIKQTPNGNGQNEQCDDGNNNNNDSCNNSCQTVTQPNCGNGTVETGEQCDDGNQSNADQCNNSCQKTSCQDGIKQTPNGNGVHEQCDDGNSNNNDACTNACTLPNEPALDIEKDDFVTLVDRNQTVTYQITARNTSNVSASTVTVVDVLPSKMTFSSASDNGSHNNGTVTWNLGTLAAGASRTVTLTATVNQSANDNESLTNNVDIRLNNVVKDTDQDIDTVRSGSSVPPFTLTKTDGESEVEPGDELTYIIRARNNSNQTVTNVRIVDELPSDVEFDDCSDDCDEDDGEVEWDNLTFAPNEEKSFRIDVTVDDNADDGDELRNEVTLRQSALNIFLTAIDRTDIEEDEDDDDDDLDVELTKRASTSEVFPGGIIEYTVTVENTGDTDIQDLTLVDRLPGGITIIDDGDADDRSGNSSLEWEIDELDEGDTFTVRYTVATDLNAFPGSSLRNDVRLTAEDDDIDERASVTVFIIGDLPQTGAANRNRYGSQYITKMNASSDSSASGIIAFASIATTLAGAGFGAYRKFFV